MDVSMTLPTMLPHGRHELVAWCRGVDAGPWASLAVPERITYTSHALVVQLAAAAALTERVRLWTTISILPAHDAVDVAKQMASVDRLCGGRLTLGVGVGGREHDYRALGAPFERRWQRLDEQVARMRSIWAGHPPFTGADPVGPPPVQDGGPPLVSGAWGPRALARAARWAAGVSGFTFDADEAALRSGFAAVGAAWQQAGRDDRPHLSTSIWFALGEGAEARLRAYASDYLHVLGDGIARYAADTVTCWSAEALRRAVGAAEAAGADEVFLVPTTADPADLDRAATVLG